MRSRCRNTTALALSVFISAVCTASYADPTDDTHKSIIGLPSVPQDFVQAPGLDSRGLASPGLASPSANQFRYLKMDYAVRKDIEPENKDEAPDTTSPAKKSSTKPRETTPTTAPSTAPSAQSTTASRTEGIRFDSHSAPLDLTPLNLTADQKQKICDLHKDNIKKARDIRKLLKTKKEELATAMFDPDQSEASIREKRDAVRTVHEQMEDLAFDEIIKVRQLLNPEQKKHLAECKPTRVGRPEWDERGTPSTASDSTKASPQADGSDLSKADTGKTPGKIAEVTKVSGVKSSAKDAPAKTDSKAAKSDATKQ